MTVIVTSSLAVVAPSVAVRRSDIGARRAECRKRADSPGIEHRYGPRPVHETPGCRERARPSLETVPSSTGASSIAIVRSSPAETIGGGGDRRDHNRHLVAGRRHAVGRVQPQDVGAGHPQGDLSVLGRGVAELDRSGAAHHGPSHRDQPIGRHRAVKGRDGRRRTTWSSPALTTGGCPIGPRPPRRGGDDERRDGDPSRRIQLYGPVP